MKLIPTHEFAYYLCYLHSYGAKYNNQILLISTPQDPSVLGFRLTPDYKNMGYGQGLRRSKPTNPIHDNLFKRIKRFIRNL